MFYHGTIIFWPWLLGLSFFIAIERLGQRELAIANIVRSIYIVMLIPVQALSTTTNSLVSNLIGAGGIAHVIRLIWRIARMSFFIMIVCVAIVVLLPSMLCFRFHTNEQALLVESVPSLYVIAVAMVIASVANVYFNAISGTGNTQAALILEMGHFGVLYPLHSVDRHGSESTGFGLFLHRGGVL